MEKVLNGISLACIGIGAALTVIIVVLGKQTGPTDLFAVLTVLNGIAFVSLTIMLVVEKDKVLRKIRARTLINRTAGIMSQLLTAMVATIFGTIVGVCMPLLLASVALFARWLAKRIRRYRSYRL